MYSSPQKYKKKWLLLLLFVAFHVSAEFVIGHWTIESASIWTNSWNTGLRGDHFPCPIIFPFICPSTIPYFLSFQSSQPYEPITRILVTGDDRRPILLSHVTRPLLVATPDRAADPAHVHAIRTLQRVLRCCSECCPTLWPAPCLLHGSLTRRIGLLRVIYVRNWVTSGLYLCE
jgi:hypothetical protein